MASELPRARQLGDGKLHIPSRTYEFLLEAMPEFERAFYDPASKRYPQPMIRERENLQALRDLLTLAAPMPGGDMLISSETTRYLYACLHDFMIHFLVFQQPRAEAVRRRLQCALGEPQAGEALEGPGRILDAMIAKSQGDAATN